MSSLLKGGSKAPNRKDLMALPQHVTEITDPEFDRAISAASIEEIEEMGRQLTARLEKIAPEIAILVSRKGRLERQREEKKKQPR